MELVGKLKRLQERYEHGDRRPLPGYLLSLGAYGAFTGALVLAGKRTGARLPKRIGLGDTVLLAVATHKASRLLTKEAITSPLRAPFTRYEKPAGQGELVESVSAHGAGHAAGELLTCPFCAAVWIATGLSAGLVLAPRATRLAGTVLAAVAGSDLLQLGYDRARRPAG